MVPMRRKSGRGFTLLELVVALGISGLVLLMVGASLRLCIRSWEKSNVQLQRHQRLRTIGNGLASELSSATLPRTSTARRVVFERDTTYRSAYLGREEEDTRTFVGRIDSIAFVTPLVILAGKPAVGLYRVEYFVRAEQDGEPGLVCRIGPYFGPDYVPDETEMREILIHPDVTEMEFSYLNPSKDKDATGLEIETPLAEGEEITVPPEMIGLTFYCKAGASEEVEEYRLSIPLGTGYGMLVEGQT